MTWKQLVDDPKFIGGVLESVENDGRYRMIIRSIQYTSDWIVEIRVGPIIKEAYHRWIPHKDCYVFEIQVQNPLGNLPIDTRGPRPIYAPLPPELFGLSDGRAIIVPYADPVIGMILYPQGMLVMSELVA